MAVKPEKKMQKKPNKFSPIAISISDDSESGATDTDIEIIYADEAPLDESFQAIDSSKCYICNSGSGSVEQWVGCDECARFAHKVCTKDEVLLSLDDEEDIKE